MKRNDSTFKEMVSRIQSGELTRHQAADAYGVGYGTLCVWLSRSKLNESTVQRSPDGTRMRMRYGAAVEWGVPNPEAMAAAVQRVLRGEISAQAASKQSPELNSRTLAKKVRKERLAQGQMVQYRARRPGPTIPTTGDAK